MKRIAIALVALTASSLLTACIFAPPISTPTDTAAITKLSEQAVAACGAGKVKEVNAKSFTCK